MRCSLLPIGASFDTTENDGEECAADNACAARVSDALPFSGQTQQRCVSRGVLFVACCLACAIPFPYAYAQAEVCPAHTFWEISSRHLPDCPSPNCSHSLLVSRCAERVWQRSEMNELLQASGNGPDVRTVVYVHGNWMTPEEARIRAATAYAAVVRASDSPVCFIAYSWPSEREHGFAKDIVGKKDRIDVESYYLAGVLVRLPSDSQVGMIGFSFGARVTCGALHLLAGGCLSGQTLNEPVTGPRNFRVSLSAPAFDRTSLSASGPYNQTLSVVDQLVNLYNSTDPVLRRFRFFDREQKPVAAGFAGILNADFTTGGGDQPLQAGPNIRQYDCKVIGRTHAELAYYQCSAMHHSIANVLGRE